MTPWRYALGPWMPIVDGLAPKWRAHVHGNGSNDKSGRAAELTPPPSTHWEGRVAPTLVEVTRLREAMELIALALALDAQQLAAVVCEKPDHSACCIDHVSMPRALRVVLKCAHGQWCAAGGFIPFFTMPWTEETASTEYRETKQVLLAYTSPSSDLNAATFAKPRIEAGVVLHLPEYGNRDSRVKDAIKFLQFLDHNAFRVLDMKVFLASEELNHDRSPELLTLVQSYRRRCNVGLRLLLPNLHEDNNSFMKWGTLFRLATRLPSEPEEAVKGRILHHTYSLSIACSGKDDDGDRYSRRYMPHNPNSKKPVVWTDVRVVAACYSALATSQGISSLKLTLPLHGSSDCKSLPRAKWLAHALASSGIREVHLIIQEIDDENVAAMQRVLAATDPLRELWTPEWSACVDDPDAPEPEPEETKEDFAHCSWLDLPKAKVQTLTADAIAMMEGVILMHDDSASKWVDVYVPGRGQCSIRRNEFSPTSTEERATSKTPTAITTLQVTVIAEEKESEKAFRALLPLIATRTQALEVNLRKDGISGQTLLTILETCGELRVLTVQIGLRLSDLKIGELVTRERHSHQKAPCLSKLSLSCVSQPSDEQGNHCFVWLMRRYGSNLTSVSIYNSRGEDSFDSTLEAILEACPRMQSLELGHGSFDSLARLVEAYNRPQCQLKSLAFHDIEWREESIIPLLNALADNSSAVSKTLQSWRLGTEQFGVDACRRLMNLCKRNHRLIELQLDLPRLKAHHAELVAGAREFEGQELNRPPPIVQRAALISALLQRSLPWVPVGLSNIFAFAATRVTRRITITHEIQHKW